MKDPVKLSLCSEPNGAVKISNNRTTITIDVDGTVYLSSYDPIKLTGASLAKLDNGHVPSVVQTQVQAALGQRLEKKTSN